MAHTLVYKEHGPNKEKNKEESLKIKKIKKIKKWNA